MEPSRLVTRTLLSNQLSVLDLLGVLFVAFKLAGIITWSWWWVVAPFVAPYLLAAGTFLGVTVVWLLGSLVLGWWTRWQSRRKRDRLRGHTLQV